MLYFKPFVSDMTAQFTVQDKISSKLETSEMSQTANTLRPSRTPIKLSGPLSVISLCLWRGQEGSLITLIARFIHTHAHTCTSAVTQLQQLTCRVWMAAEAMIKGRVHKSWRKAAQLRFYKAIPSRNNVWQWWTSLCRNVMMRCVWTILSV